MPNVNRIHRLVPLFIPLGLTWLATGLFAQETADKSKDEFTSAQIEFFESKVRPLLVEHCYECHGPDAEYQEGGLNLGSRKSILTGGDSGPAIDLEYPADSFLLDAVQYGDLFQMPPDSKLSDEKIEIIRQWVMDKAPWPSEEDIEVARSEEFDLQQRRESHWCWQPITEPAPPTVNRSEWPLDPLDRFVLAKLEQAGLSPADPADRKIWLRRVTYDLIGLPPTPEEIEDFVNDTDADAYEKVVDRLLASPRFGERWARHWMDLIRYAESCGHEFDYPIPNAFQYRDYLIRAFNADVPYDQFVIEHIAGDLLDRPRRHPETGINESVLGTGFWFLGEATHGPVDVKGDEAGRIDNQIDVMGKTFLGLTVACARCHDHKFDAISTEDYYSFAGFLQSSRRQNVMLDPHQKIDTAYRKSLDAAEDVSKAIDQFIRDIQLDSSPDQTAKLMKAAVLFLQQDHRWLIPEQRIVEGESLKPKSISAGKARRQDLSGWNGGAQIWWTDAKVGDTLELEIEVPVEGRYELLANFTKAPDYGIVQVSINGAPVGEPVDLYHEKVARTGDQSLGTHAFSKGTQVVRLELTGKNEKAVDKYMAGIDYFMLRGKPPAEDSEASETDRIKRLCDEFDVQPDSLRRWIAAIQDPKTDQVDHPLYLLRQSAESKLDLQSEKGDLFYRQMYQRLKDAAKANAQWDEKTKSATSIGWNVPSRRDQWKETGFAFRQYDPAPRLNVSDEFALWCQPEATPHSGWLGGKYQGVLRSETFEITHPMIQYHVAAKNAQIRLIIDGFRLDIYNPLLFNGMSIEVDTGGQWKWITQSGDLKNYIGHRAFIEIIDQGDGFIGLDEIRFTSRPKPGGEPSAYSVDPQFHPIDNESWREARRDQGKSPLEIVTQSLATALQPARWIDPRTRTVNDTQLLNFFVRHRLFQHQNYKDLNHAVETARSRLKNINDSTPEPVLAIGMVDGTPENEYVFIRGNHKNLGEVAPRSPLKALVGDSWEDKSLQGSGRMALARHMVSPDHPLVRRVIVNRIWHHLTGQGLVASVDNFGVLGEQPTHPKLLDYLATEFSSDDWSIKSMIRRIVLSQTYRMSSVSSVDASEKDPNNDLLYKFRIRRLEGEAIRDAILAISGELDETMYGPSVPIHLTSFMQGRGRPGQSGPLDGNGRRSVYIEVRRNFLSPMMLAFDTPIPFNSIGRRNSSNVPAQALIMMNDPFVVSQAEAWANRLIEEYESVDQRLRHAFVSAVGREPTDAEIKNLMKFLDKQRAAYSENQLLQSWRDLCHVLFNLKEFIYVR